MSWQFSRHFFYALLSGICFALAVTVPLLWWLVWPGVVLFLTAIQGASSYWQVAIFGFVAGAIKIVGATLWLWHAVPLAWIEVDNLLVQIILTILFQAPIALVGGLGLVLPAIFYHYFHQRKWLIVVAWPVIWVVGEVLGSLLVSILLLGHGSSVNIFLGYGYAGLPLISASLLAPAAVLAGIYGLTYVAALAGLALFLVLGRDRFSVVVGIILIGILSLGQIVYWLRSETDDNQKIIAVDTFFAANDSAVLPGSTKRIAAVQEATVAALQLNPDVVLLPEDARLTTSQKETLAQLVSITPESRALVVDSARIDRVDGSAVLRAFYYDLNTRETYQTDKQFLVPAGEYVPHIFSFFISLFDDGEIAKDIRDNRNYVPGPYHGFTQIPSYLPALIFCYESVSPLSVKIVSHSSDSSFVLHPLSHDWFRNPFLMWHQLDLMLETQALWNGKAVISAGNMSPSRAYDEDGTIKEGRVVGQGEYWRLVEYDI